METLHIFLLHINHLNHMQIQYYNADRDFYKLKTLITHANFFFSMLNELASHQNAISKQDQRMCDMALVASLITAKLHESYFEWLQSPSVYCIAELSVQQYDEKKKKNTWLTICFILPVHIYE